jgi:anti-sigma factor RsiW
MAMPCRRARRLISREIDEALDLKETARLRYHLVTCPRCAQFRTTLRHARRTLHHLDEPHEPDSFAESTLALWRRRNVAAPGAAARAIPFTVNGGTSRPAVLRSLVPSAAALVIMFFSAAVIGRGVFYPAVVPLVGIVRAPPLQKSRYILYTWDALDGNRQDQTTEVIRGFVRQRPLVDE